MEQKQVDNISKNLGKLLLTSGLRFVRQAYSLSPQVYTNGQINNILNPYKYPSLSLSDEKYSVIDWPTWRAIIDNDWSKERQYKADIWDCDNYAFLFAARMAEIFELNTAGVCYGEVFDKNTKKKVAGHAFNLVIAKDGDTLKPFLFEPENGKYTEWVKNKENVIENWIYKINWVIFF